MVTTVCGRVQALQPGVALARLTAQASHSHRPAALPRLAALAAHPMTEGRWGGSILSQRRGAETSSFNLRPSATQAGAEPLDEVDWSRELCNTIYLLGRTGQDFEVKYLQNAQVVGMVPLAIKNIRDETMWVNLEVWGPLAETAAQSVAKGQQIAIQGRLKIDKWQDKEGQLKSITKVVVNQLKLVRSTAPTGEAQGSPVYQQAPAPGQPRAAALSTAPGQQSAKPTAQASEKKWGDFFDSPGDYYDNRKSKQTGERSPKYPDFKHKESGEALWLTSYDTPAWVASSIEKLDSLHADQKDAVDGLPDLTAF